VRLQSEIVVERTNEQVWRFFSDPANLARWDRSVARVVVTSREPFGVGSTFDTIAPGNRRAKKACACPTALPNMCQIAR
jgi:ligand-binding SRPBCC domain-containing protein